MRILLLPLMTVLLLFIPSTRAQISTADTYEAAYEVIVTDYRSGVPVVASHRTGKYVFDATGRQRRDHATPGGEPFIEIWIPELNVRYAINPSTRTGAVGPMNMRFSPPGLTAAPSTPRARRRIPRSEIPTAAVQVTSLGETARGPVLLHGGSTTHQMGDFSRSASSWVYRPPLDVLDRSPRLTLESESTITDAQGNPVTHSIKRVTDIRRIPANATNFALPAGIEIVRDVFAEAGLERPQ